MGYEFVLRNVILLISYALTAPLVYAETQQKNDALLDLINWADVYSENKTALPTHADWGPIEWLARNKDNVVGEAAHEMVLQRNLHRYAEYFEPGPRSQRDYITALRTPQLQNEMGGGFKPFLNTADLLETLENGIRDADEAVTLALLELSAWTFGDHRIIEARDYSKVRQSRPHWVRRASRVALLRVHPTVSLPALSKALKGDAVVPVFKKVKSRDAIKFRTATSTEKQVALDRIGWMVLKGVVLGGEVLEVVIDAVTHDRDSLVREQASLVLGQIIRKSDDSTLIRQAVNQVCKIFESFLRDKDLGPLGLSAEILKKYPHIQTLECLSAVIQKQDFSSLREERIQMVWDIINEIVPASFNGTDRTARFIEYYTKEKSKPAFIQAIDRARERKIATLETAEGNSQSEKSEPPPIDGPTPEDRSVSAHFFGIELVGTQIAYVLDRSGSMEWELDAKGPPPQNQTIDPEKQRIKFARDSLLKSLDSLQKDQRFNLIFFGDDTDLWSKQPELVSPQSIRNAKKTILEKKPAGGTNFFGGLMASLGLREFGDVIPDKHYATYADQIVFLSDGEPSVGDLTDPEDILDEVQWMNRYNRNRLRIDTIALGDEADPRFLYLLAIQNGGGFEAVVSSNAEKYDITKKLLVRYSPE